MPKGPQGGATPGRDCRTAD